jgi:transcriptional regulator with XRE-family HTH domain
MPKSTPVKRAVRHMHPMDIHVGLRIRQRRILLGMNMWNLGAAVGLSFQMIQKYEAGLYCIPVSRLFELAKALDVPPSFFFEGPRPRAKDDSLYTRETMDLVPLTRRFPVRA